MHYSSNGTYKGERVEVCLLSSIPCGEFRGFSLIDVTQFHTLVLITQSIQSGTQNSTVFDDAHSSDLVTLVALLRVVQTAGCWRGSAILSTKTSSAFEIFAV